MSRSASISDSDSESSAASSSSSPGPSSPPPKSVAPGSKRKRTRHDDSDSDSESDDDDDDPASASMVVDEHEEANKGEEEDTPVLSHAERRRQKKKAKHEEAAKPSSSATTKTKDEQKADSKKSKAGKISQDSEKPIMNKGLSVWVGNLSFKTTAQNLREFFADVGEITRINMPMRTGSKTEIKGFAYVDFASAEAKAKAISYSEKPLIGRRLLIKDGNDFAGRPAPPIVPGESTTATVTKTPGLSKTAQKILKVQKQPPGPTLFLGNLGFEATEKSIREMLEAHRKKPKKADGTEDIKHADSEAKTDDSKDKWIRKIRLGTFEDSGNCKGWAFVDFTNTEHATAVLVNPANHHLDGRKLVVEYASPDAVRRGGGPRPPDGAKTSRQQQPSEKTQSLSSPEKKPEGREQQQDEHRVEKTERKKFDRPDHATKREVPARPLGKGREYKPRSKPGAALALAKRESAAIIPSQGKKITFD